jgi:hypothetical protein
MPVLITSCLLKAVIYKALQSVAASFLAFLKMAFFFFMKMAH